MALLNNSQNPKYLGFPSVRRERLTVLNGFVYASARRWSTLSAMINDCEAGACLDADIGR